jgi:hypothetical protein
MPETVPERHYRDRVQSVRQLVSRLESDHATLSWQDYEDLVAVCVELSASAADLMEKAYHRIFKEANLTVAWLHERRRVLEELSDDYVQLAESVQTLAPQAGKTTAFPRVEDLRIRLENGIRAVIEAKQRVLGQWLVTGPQEMAAAKAAIARGEVQDADEAFAEIAGTDVESWRKSVEEYKQSRERPAEK